MKNGKDSFKTSNSGISNIAAYILNEKEFSEESEKAIIQLFLPSITAKQNIKLRKLTVAILLKHFESNIEKPLRLWSGNNEKRFETWFITIKGGILLEKKNLTSNEINDLIRIVSIDEVIFQGGYLDSLQLKLLSKHVNKIDIHSQVQILEKWFFSHQTRILMAIELVTRNYDRIEALSPILRKAIRYVSGNHSNRKEIAEANRLIYSVLGNFDKISNVNKFKLIECFVKSMSDKTESAVRKILSRRFNLLEFNFKNRMLSRMMNNFELPSYYLQSFLHKNRDGLNELNVEEILKKLEKENGR